MNLVFFIIFTENLSRCLFVCGSGFPAATIEAESLSHREKVDVFK